MLFAYLGIVSRVNTPALTLDNFDQSVRPTQDLFRFVNGTWLANATIPEDRSRWGTFDQLREKSEQDIREIIEELSPQQDPSTERSKIANLFASFMDEQKAEDLATTPLQPLLARVDAIDSVAALARHWGWSVRHGVTSLSGFGNEADPGDPKRYLMFVVQDGIGLPDEEYYRLDQHAEIRESYLTHITKALKLAGVAEAEQQARAAFELETLIASHHWDKVRTRDMVEMYHLQTWEQFTAESPALEWDEFLAGAQLPKPAVGEVVNCQRTFFGEVAALVTTDRLEQWKSWARWHVVDALAPFLNDALVQENFDFNSRILQGVPKLRERWKRGVSLVEAVLGEAVGKIYVERHFPPATKARADDLVANLLEAYRRSISALDWMTEETRTQALDKLSKFRPKIGYPVKWRDYSGLQVVPGDLVGNVLRANSFGFDYTIEKLSGPVDPNEWLMFPQTVNAYYHPLRNEIVFPAAILQPPFFNPDADDAVNYGGIGAVIGHEIGHGFDDKGSTCDGDGRLRNWWSDQDRAAFEARTAKLVDQYNALAPSVTPDVHVNGELTLGENIGDLGGLSIAYQAWQIAIGGNNPEPVGGFTGQQRVFLGWAQCWCCLIRPQAMKERLATDPHSPDELRCNQVVRNIPAFHEAFGTKPGESMWLDPDKRVQIW